MPRAVLAKRVLLLFACLLSLLSLMSMGCARWASLKPNYAYRGAGAEDQARDHKIAERADRNQAPGTDAVFVFLDASPEGIELKDDIASVKPGYAHQILGSVALHGNRHEGWIALVGFPEYSDAWRKAYCYPQTVLTWVTLTVWATLPVAFPCWGEPDIDPREIMTGLKRVAAAAGGDAVVAGYRRAPRGISVGGTGRVLGYVLRLDPQVKIRLSAQR